MSDNLADAPYFKKLRKCVYCKGDIAARRPVFLVTRPNGQIIGPFHAGCAERLKLRPDAESAIAAWQQGQTFGTWPRAREETLPE